MHVPIDERHPNDTSSPGGGSVNVLDFLCDGQVGLSCKNTEKLSSLSCSGHSACFVQSGPAMEDMLGPSLGLHLSLIQPPSLKGAKSFHNV